MKLALGCGNEAPAAGWLGVDGSPLARPDVVHDLNTRPWPFEDGSIQEIRALDVLEHLDDVVGFMDECHRVLAPGGVLTVRVPHFESENTWRDPTHRRAFHPDVFRYFDPRSEWCQRYGRLYTERFWYVVEVTVDEDENITARMVTAESTRLGAADCDPPRAAESTRLGGGQDGRE